MQVILTNIFQKLIFIKYNLNKQNNQKKNIIQYKFTYNHTFIIKIKYN